MKKHLFSLKNVLTTCTATYDVTFRNHSNWLSTCLKICAKDKQTAIAKKTAWKKKSEKSYGGLTTTDPTPHLRKSEGWD